MRAVIDTNVLIAGLLWRGTPHLLLQHARGGAVGLDDEVLALAIAAKVEIIVSGDEDLLSLRSFQGIPILAPAEAMRFVGATDQT